MNKMLHPAISKTQRFAPPALAMALAASILLHVIAYWVTPRVTTTFTPTKPVQYDASLVPIESLPAAANVRSVAAATPKQITGSAARSQPRRTTPRSEADFAPPDNAMAVAAAAPTDAPESSVTTAGPAGADSLPASRADDPSVNNEAASRAPISPDPSPPPTAAPAPARRAPAFAERISIEYKLITAITDGVASFRWTRRGPEYEIESSIQATGFLVSAFAGVIHQQSRGTITDDGLRPQQFSIRRGEGEAELAEFRHGTNSLAMKRNGETRLVPLSRDMQDMQSFLFQLAYDAPQLSEGNDKLDVLVTNARKVYRYQFRKLGTETLDTRIGPIETVRLLSEAANPEDQYEVWLAPGYFYLPLKLKYYLGRFQVEQLVTRIGVSGEVTAR